MQSLRSIVRWVVRIVEKVLEFGESVLARLPEVGKGSGPPALKLVDRWEIRRVAGQERPHRRTSGQSSW